MKNARKAWDPGSDSLPPPLFGGKYMDNSIVSIISSVGFPIAMCLLMFWYMQKETENQREETNGLKDAINELKMAIATLIEKLEK